MLLPCGPACARPLPTHMGGGLRQHMEHRPVSAHAHNALSAATTHPPTWGRPIMYSQFPAARARPHALHICACMPLAASAPGSTQPVPSARPKVLGRHFCAGVLVRVCICVWHHGLHGTSHQQEGAWDGKARRPQHLQPARQPVYAVSMQARGTPSFAREPTSSSREQLLVTWARPLQLGLLPLPVSATAVCFAAWLLGGGGGEVPPKGLHHGRHAALLS